MAGESACRKRLSDMKEESRQLEQCARLQDTQPEHPVSDSQCILFLPFTDNSMASPETLDMTVTFRITCRGVQKLRFATILRGWQRLG